jgi:hypothetical protein
MAVQLRAKQAETLDFFNQVAKKGATITDVREQFEITHPSARSRCIYLKEKKLLKQKEERTQTNTPLIRFYITAAGRKALKRAAA